MKKIGRKVLAFTKHFTFPNFFAQKRLREIHSHVMFNAYFAGRIAQLVERLSYTQVVIGSSPVAPITCKICGSSSIG